MTRIYRHTRYHYSRFDTSICPNPEACAHTTDVHGESCECCGTTIGKRMRWSRTTVQATPGEFRVLTPVRVERTYEYCLITNRTLWILDWCPSHGEESPEASCPFCVDRAAYRLLRT